jgi:acyl-CoA synthetase (AMP-forming)/AMP-acid ligase II
MPPATAAGLADRFPQVALFDVWGLSETHGPATARRWTPEPLPTGTVGRPIAGVEVRAVGEDGRPLPAGVSGELGVRGANVSPGYVDDPETTAAVLRDGWLATGDLGTVASDGTVRILDRRKDVILRGGANVFSVEVEEVLSSAAAVAEAAVFGVPDGLGGEAVTAAVVLVPDATLDVAALRRLVADRIGVHATPRRVIALDSLPRNPNGKIDKPALRTATR